MNVPDVKWPHQLISHPRAVISCPFYSRACQSHCANDAWASCPAVERALGWSLRLIETMKPNTDGDWEPLPSCKRPQSYCCVLFAVWLDICHGIFHGCRLVRTFAIMRCLTRLVKAAGKPLPPDALPPSLPLTPARTNSAEQPPPPPQQPPATPQPPQHAADGAAPYEPAAAARPSSERPADGSTEAPGTPELAPSQPGA